MKLTTIFLILFLIKSSISISLEDYSIDRFKERLKENGLFETILLVKEYYGTDLSIISCEELNKSGYGNCKKLITEYMPNKFANHTNKIDMPPGRSMNSQEKNKKEIEELSKAEAKRKDKRENKEKLKIIEVNEQEKDLKPKHEWDKLLKILSTKFPPEEAKFYAEKIIKRVEQLHYTIF